MTVSLQKGQRVDLTKGNPSLTTLHVGLGWDTKTGLFGSEIDIDGSAILLDENGRKQDVVSFRQLKSKCGSVKHSGDNLTGAGSGDDEIILIDLNKVPHNVHKIVFVLNIYSAHSRGQDFGKVKNAFVRVLDASSKSEQLRFNLSDDYKGKTAMIIGEVYRYNTDWKFSAIGEGTTDGSINDLEIRYN